MSPLALSLRFLQAQPDARLVDLARAGHAPAFEALVRRYRQPLLGYSRRFASAQAAPEDIVQQAFLQAWSALSAGVEVRDLRAWLYRIVHNVAVSALGRAADLVELDESAVLSATEDLPEQRLAARAALAGMAALPELQREVMVRVAVDGMSYDEIAGALGVSSGAVRGLIHRARTTLRAAAAALTPGPVVQWAARQAVLGSSGPATWSEVAAGGGSAGLAGLLLKGGAVVATAGLIAGTVRRRHRRWLDGLHERRQRIKRRRRKHQRRLRQHHRRLRQHRDRRWQLELRRQRRHERRKLELNRWG